MLPMISSLFIKGCMERAFCMGVWRVPVVVWYVIINVDLSVNGLLEPRFVC